jgi:hypothetical protein
VLSAYIPRERLVPLIERRWTSRGRSLVDLARHTDTLSDEDAA